MRADAANSSSPPIQIKAAPKNSSGRCPKNRRSRSIILVQCSTRPHVETANSHVRIAIDVALTHPKIAPAIGPGPGFTHATFQSVARAAGAIRARVWIEVAARAVVVELGRVWVGLIVALHKATVRTNVRLNVVAVRIRPRAGLGFGRASAPGRQRGRQRLETRVNQLSSAIAIS